MAPRTLVWLAALAIAASGCSGSEPSTLRDEFTTFPPPATPTPSTTTTAPPPQPTATTTPPPPPDTQAGPSPSAPGRLVILDEDGNVAVLAPDGTGRVTLTDAFTEGAAYFQPVWAPGAADLAWAEASPAGFGITTAAADGSQRASAGTPAPPFYFYWSRDGSRLAALHNGLNGVELRIVENGGTVAAFAGSGVPFYFSWNPVGDDLIAHIGADRLAGIDRLGTATEVAPTDPGYQSPQWLPSGILHLADGALVIVADDGSTTSAARLRGNASFVADAQGSRVAVQSFSEDDPALSVALQSAPEVPPNVVAVVDLDTGAIDIAAAERSVGFFWSPDGTKLLMFHPSPDPGSIDVSVWEDGTTASLTRFTPQSSFIRDVLPFFPQYAQSYRVWSPDSTAYAFSGTIAGEEGIWIHHIEDGGAPELITAGTWVAWSDR